MQNLNPKKKNNNVNIYIYIYFKSRSNNFKFGNLSKLVANASEPDSWISQYL